LTRFDAGDCTDGTFFAISRSSSRGRRPEP
jgi:hypothetical protein